MNRYRRVFAGQTPRERYWVCIFEEGARRVIAESPTIQGALYAKACSLEFLLEEIGIWNSVGEYWVETPDLRNEKAR